jgi:hypothetical protein
VVSDETFERCLNGGVDRPAIRLAQRRRVAICFQCRKCSIYPAECIPILDRLFTGLCFFFWRYRLLMLLERRRIR